jgi:hypothetical protein
MVVTVYLCVDTCHKVQSAEQLQPATHFLRCPQTPEVAPICCTHACTHVCTHATKPQYMREARELRWQVDSNIWIMSNVVWSPPEFRNERFSRASPELSAKWPKSRAV